MFASAIIRSSSSMLRLNGNVANGTSAVRALSSAAGAKLSGTVKWFDNAKGFGFIVPTDGTEDVFVHQSKIHADGFRTLQENESVEYILETNAENGKLFANDVTGPNGDFVKGGSNMQRSEEW